MRVNGNPLLLELHHLSSALPPFLAAAHTAASHGVRPSCGAVAGGVTFGGPVSPGCLLLGASGPQGHCCPLCLVCMCWGALVQLLLVAQQFCVGEGLVILLPALLQIDLL